ncbi:MAG: adenylate/guanylate cyclase domain-containing protein [Acidimicrobiia bacterium]|nr:adenylate/guanylate cyclase domain-containing protein [Acidimicrobiia bacterium]
MEDSTGNGQPTKAGGKAYRTSLATRLAIAVLVVAVVTIVVTVAVSTARIGDTADELVNLRITARSSALAQELNDYFRNAANDATFIAASNSTAEALEAFSAAYQELDRLDVATLESQRASVGEFYLGEFLPTLSDVRGESVEPDAVIPRSSGAPIYLQAAYIADVELPADQRQLITDPNDGSSWTAAHTQYHPGLRAFANGFRFLDLFLIDAETQSVVYSTNKDITFGTNLVAGPHSGTSMASLARRAITEGSAGDVFSTDFATYPPALDQPSGFMASPIVVDDEVRGVVVVSLDLETVSNIMTLDWRSGRFGETGEAYLVGSDRTMRSDSRLFLEDPDAYFARIDEVGTTPDIDRARMESLGTTVVFQPVDNEAVRSGLEGDTDISTVTNYLGREVYSAYAPIAPDSFDWVLLVEQEVAEAEEPLADYIRSSLTITVVFMVLLTFAAVAWASSLVAPLRRMGAALHSARVDAEPRPIPVTGVTEFRRLAERLNSMVEGLAVRKEQVLRALRAKTAVLRTLVPNAALAQVQVGERRFIETVPQSTVASIHMDGIDALVQRGDDDASREFLVALVEAADGVADQFGLERVKLTGPTYQAVAGLGTAHLDHAPRAARFVAETIREIDQLAKEAGVDLALSGGISSGTVTAGLVGDSRLVFDLWGEPVDEADRLAAIAPADRIYVSSSAKQRLPDGVPAIEVRTPLGETAWAIDVNDELGLEVVR